ncbi:ethanolamine ammonia-lyase reactivating factor EutA [Neobacillus sp. DY30]|uniref:ethanolamine ammonia-lyase reactivating factor EutA n=1 Tax=Neobacillus sp. DY30 TaxID=3047871 RepID=UPI0024BFBE70|nr:ethanolamine ammonia-lyase reactivating factor EutA [Neobacillus sp. DY30]WHY03552.1 ethanolamine ammonia-lyase reactivating factor EutA [Neobacillus sp. DY30]
MKRYEPQHEEILSAGIDIGTSTTKLVISKFSLMNVAGGMHMPRIEIINKEVLYRSPIYRTPLLYSTSINSSEVESLVQREYLKAGIKPKTIKTGAVIITGETATKQNAQEMVHHLSNHAGDFLVATAGPDLEGIIAAKGSGAFEYSKKSGKVIANIDIGGGTANVAVYKSGKLLGTCTLHIGGRLIEFAGSKITSISPPVRELFQQWRVQVKEGNQRKDSIIKGLTEYMSAVIARMLNRQLLKTDKPLLLGHAPNWRENIDEIMFSGGVSECLYRYENGSPVTAQYDDIGEILAASLRESKELSQWTWVKPDETVRATVLGAGTQTTEISGATIQVDSSQLPLRNLPVYQVPFGHDLQEGLKKLPAAVQHAVDVYDSQREGQNFALFLTEIPYLGFRDIQQLAAAILESVKVKPNGEQPLVIVLESDHAKVLGQTIKVQNPKQNIICIDQIRVENGDYIDIGHLLQTSVVPVVIKTLTFHH